MLVLGIESATPVASVALSDEQGLLGEVLLNVGLTHSEQLLPMIDDLLRQCRRTIRDVTAIGVSAGPGSFTGLRIGMATAKALAQGALPHTPVSPGVRLLAIPTLEAMAWQLKGCGRDILVSPMLNARREQIYTALYRWRTDNAAYADATGTAVGATGATGAAGGDVGAGGATDGGAGRGGEDKAMSLREVFAARQRGKKDRMPAGAGDDFDLLELLVPPEAVSPKVWAKRLAEHGQDVYLLGDGAAMYQEIWHGDLRGRAIILPPAAGLCRGSFVALAAMRLLQESGSQDSQTPCSGQSRQDFYGMKPIYLRGI